ncbi:MAG: CHAD domain-containing protein [Actinomycetota bacterium]|nr:CHAD domain-containing protein [Actinomycetota bacterium]
MKARKVKGLNPRAPLAENSASIIRVRLAELRSFIPGALREEAVEEQHHMRIAAKRLRYILEITESCFGPDVVVARRRTRDLQGILGDLHDCDVMLPRVGEHRARSRAADPATIPGLDALATHLRQRRRQLFGQFREFWLEQEREGIWERLERTTAP